VAAPAPLSPVPGAAEPAATPCASAGPDAEPALAATISCLDFVPALDVIKKTAAAAAAITPPPAMTHTAFDFWPRAASIGVMPAASAPAISVAPGIPAGIAGSEMTCACTGSATARRPLCDDDRSDSSYASCWDVMRREMRCLAVCASAFMSCTPESSVRSAVGGVSPTGGGVAERGASLLVSDIIATSSSGRASRAITRAERPSK
jgi:hypothetical protein